MTQPLILDSVASAIAWRRAQTEPVVAVFTMGALHSGHSELMRSARAYLDRNYDGRGSLVVSIFVNPTQFENVHDLEAYPRTDVLDYAVCEAARVDAIFQPSAADMYPTGLDNVVTVHPHDVATILEGESRPGHFVGMLTVVNKLLNVTQPWATFFGEKDYQQLTLVRTMVRDLNMNVDVVGVPTVRDLDGVALSSRNQRLDAHGRELAAQLPAAIAVSRHALSEGHTVIDSEKMGYDYLNSQNGIKVDYFTILSNDLSDAPAQGSARLLVAATIDGVRLIDNAEVEI